jgi:calcium permeable stress-gated cation channel
MLLFLDLRHQFLVSKSHYRLAQARTVLITRVPNELGNENELRTFASFVPGGVDRVWLYRDTKVPISVHIVIVGFKRLCFQ